MATDIWVELPLESGGGGGSGTVTSVALADGSTVPIYTISGSPITTAGTLTFTLTAQTPHTFLAGPSSGGSAQPTFRAILASDLPVGTGTVTSVSVVSANGLAGTVANPTTTPAISLSTTITGILQGNGTAISAATTGNLTDVGTDGITITNGTGAVLGSGTSISQHVADSTHNGYLASTDFNTFSGKQSTITIGALDAQAENANGLALVSNVLSAQSADATHPGMVNNTTQTFSGNKTLTGNTISQSLEVNGTAGAGFVQYDLQSVTPSTPTNSFRMYADSATRLSWVGTNGFFRTFDGTANTASHTYTLRDVDGKMNMDTRMSYFATTINTSLYTILATDGFVLYLVDTTAVRSIDLPATTAVTDRVYIFKDISGLANTNNIVLVPNGADKIEGLNVNKPLQTNYGSWTIVSDNAGNWWMV